jgi:hypothetical protein
MSWGVLGLALAVNLSFDPFPVPPPPAPPVTCRVLSPNLAERIFQHFATDPGIPFAYPEDGCHVRATLMNLALERAGIQSRRVFASDQKGNLFGNNAWADHNPTEWTFHTAPTVDVRASGGEIQTWVVDPSVAPRALPVADWLAAFKGERCAVWLRDPAYLPENQQTDFAQSYRQACVTFFKERFALSLNRPVTPQRPQRQPVWPLPLVDWDSSDLEGFNPNLRDFRALAAFRVRRRQSKGDWSPPEPLPFPVPSVEDCEP